MEIPFLIGLAVGAVWALSAIFSLCVVRTKQSEREHEVGMETMINCAFSLHAENAKLRLALAAGAMTEEGKKIAAMTTTALDSVIAAEKEAIEQDKPNMVTSQKGECSLEVKQ